MARGFPANCLATVMVLLSEKLRCASADRFKVSARVDQRSTLFPLHRSTNPLPPIRS